MITDRPNLFMIVYPCVHVWIIVARWVQKLGNVDIIRNVL